MGQSQSSTPFHQEVANSIVTSTDEYNNISYLKDKNSDEENMIRRWIFTQEIAQKNTEKALQQRLGYQSQHLLKLRKMQSSIRETPCNNYYQIDTLWQYEQHTLTHLIRQRKQLNSNFTEEQIWSLASNSINALLQMENSNTIHDKISTDSIAVKSRTHPTTLIFKIRDPLSMPQEDNFSLLLRNIQTQGIYLSPEQCQALEQFSSCKKCNKNDVWTLGMNLMETSLMQNQGSCYLQDSRKINSAKISENLNRIGKIYSQRLKNLIGSMLEVNKKQRPSWSQLNQKLNKQPINTVLKATEVGNLNTQESRESPQVFAYKSMHSPQAYSFSKSYYTGNTNLIDRRQQEKENMICNRIYIPPPQLYEKERRHIVNFTNSNQHPVIYVPIERSINKQNQNMLNHNMVRKPAYYNIQNLEQPSKVNLNQLQHSFEVRKFTSPAATQGFLFHLQPQQKQIKEATIRQQCFEKPKISQTRHQPQTSSEIKQKPHVFNNEIKNTESITYQGDFRPALSQIKKQIKQIRSRNKEPQLQQPQVQQIPLPAQYQEQKENDQDDEIEYVVETFQVGSRYEGQKLRNMRHGQGRFYYQDGGMYEGQWQYNKMNGKGKLYYQSGVLAYDGQWKNDQFEGRGKLFNESPEKLHECYDYRNFDNIGQTWQYYDGEFSNDFKQGRGKLMLTNGQYYVGSFSQDMIQGAGKFFRKQGTIKGQWQANQLIRID